MPPTLLLAHPALGGFLRHYVIYLQDKQMWKLEITKTLFKASSKKHYSQKQVTSTI